MSKRGLGRGLSALIPGAAQESQGEFESITELPLELIAPNPDQPRTDLDDEAIAELAESLRRVGLLQPIIVRPLGDQYQIIAGERRWRAARLAGLEKVPVRVISATSAESLGLALIENLQREDLNAIEEARGYRRLLDEYQMTQAELADKVSKSRSAITNAMRLLDLPDEVQELVYQGRLSAGHARAILALPEEAARTKLAHKAVDEGLSVREVESLARLYLAGHGDREPKPPAPRSYKLVARRLRKMLGTGVRVRMTKTKGRIEIDFHGEDDLERIYRILTEADLPQTEGAE